MSKISIRAKKVNSGLTADGHHYVQFVVRGSNPCCKNKPFYIAKNINGEYFCECSCGLYCTSAWKTEVEALCAYVSERWLSDNAERALRRMNE
jgi:hypothetical protein